MCTDKRRKKNYEKFTCEIVFGSHKFWRCDIEMVNFEETKSKRKIDEDLSGHLCISFVP